MDSTDQGNAGLTKRRRRLLSGISTNVLALGIVSFLTDMSSEMIYPVLPLFLVSIGATGTIIGLIEGAGESTASFLKVVSGWYSDRYGRRKPLITGGYTVSSFVKPLLYFVTSPWHVFWVRLAERVGKGVRSAPRDALIADSTDSRVRGKAFGFHKMMDSAGAVIGPLLAIVIISYAAAASMSETDGYRLVFLMAPIPAFAGVAVILLFVKERRLASRTIRRKSNGRDDRLGRSFWLLMLIVLVFYAGEVNWAFFVLKAIIGGASEIGAIALYTLFNAVFVVLSIPAGTLSDRLGRKPVIMISFGLFILSCLIMGASESIPLFMLGFVAYGAYKGTSEGVFKAYVVDNVVQVKRATALGVFHGTVGLVMLPGSVAAGMLWDVIGPWATFAYGVAMGSMAMVLLAFLGPGQAQRIA